MRTTPLLTLIGWTLLGLALVFVAGPVSAWLAALILGGVPSEPLPHAGFTSLREVLYVAPSVLVLVLWRRTNPPLHKSGPDGGLALGSLIGIALALTAIGLAAIANTISPGAGPDARTSAALIALALLGPVMVLHGCAEELVFRGVVQEAAIAVFGIRGGVVFGALGWTALQALQGFGGPIEVLNSFLIGIAFGLLALRAGVLAASAAHGLWTWTEIYLFGLGTTGTPPLFDLDITTTNLWAGPGPDTYGGLACTVAAVIFIGVTVVMLRGLPAPAKPRSSKRGAQQSGGKAQSGPRSTASNKLRPSRRQKER